MLAVAHSDYNFLFAEIGTHGRMSDGGVFNDSLLYQPIFSNNANFPEAIPLPGINMCLPYVFIADATFALSSRLMKSYPGVPSYGSRNRIFNQQLSRARVVIESTFGISIQNVCKTYAATTRKSGNYNFNLCNFSQLFKEK